MTSTRARSQPTEIEPMSSQQSAISEHYAAKRRTGLVRRISNWREISLARKALQLAGSPKEVLDLPCGAGRFWDMLAEAPDRIIHAADYSTDMLKVARQLADPDTVKRIHGFQTSAFDIDMKDGSVDCVFCMRLIHHVGEPSHRLIMLKEFHRVTRDTLCISLWVDGNRQASRRAHQIQLDQERDKPSAIQTRFVTGRKDFQAEYTEAGFELIDHLDYLRAISMWRLYILKKS